MLRLKRQLFIVVFFSFKLFALPESIELLKISDDKAVTINLKDNKNKVIVFISSKCPCSESYESTLSELSQEFSQFAFYGIHSNSDEKYELARDYFLKSKISFPIYQDNQAKIADEFKALKTPHAYVVNGQGKIVFSGGVGDSAQAVGAKINYLKNALDSILKGKEPDPKEVRVLGCSISRP